MPAILTNESASTSKPAFSPYKDATRRVRAGAPKRPPFLTLTNQPQSLAQLWPETPSPRLPPPTPKIQTVGLPMYSPTCGTLSDTPHHTHQSPSYFPMVLSPDSTPAGPFQVVRSLHSGAYGSAVAAKDLTTDRRVCLKVIEKSHVAGKGKELNAMRTELTAYKVISTAEPNAHVMDCRGVFQDDSRVFFEMDQLQTDMHSLLGDDLDPNRIKRWVAQTAVGIAAIHEMGMIHRDIKPENILVDNLDDIRITDFGSAFICNEPIISTHAYSTESAGTRQYMAPEMLKKGAYNGAVDYWALGCTMYDLIMGDILFADKEALREYRKWDVSAKGSSYFQWKAESSLTKDEDDLISGLLRKNPQKRYSVSDLRNHPYFLNKRGDNIFTEVERKSKTSAKTSYLLEEDMQPIDTCTTYRPSADPYVFDSPEFFQFAWTNPRLD